MNLVNCIETYIDKEQNHYGSFIIEPLETGQGITVGNALRRTLLSDISGFAITGSRINNLKHEFSVVEGAREDVLEILLNLKEIIFKSVFLPEGSLKDQKRKGNLKEESSQKLSGLEEDDCHFLSSNSDYRKKTGFIYTQGPTIVTAGMFFLPKDSLQIINPSQYICTIINDSEFYLEVDIEHGIGYQSAEHIHTTTLEKLSTTKPTTLRVDCVFSPVKKVNYKIKLIHDSFGNIKESLFFEILTNGSTTPKRCFHEALKSLLNLFGPLFISSNFLKVSSQLNHPSSKA